MKIRFANSIKIPASVLAERARGELFSPDTDIAVGGICTDSREADSDTAFVALRGERTDGHCYINTAIQNGCRCIFCERGASLPAISSVAFIRVDNTLQALSALASAHLTAQRIPTVAVTGSVGKTTTKDMIASVLSESFKTYASSGNHNSVIGMPLSAMETAEDDEIAVFEMGMSGFGEIEEMSMAAQPDIAVITNIGTSHMEMLGSRKNICRAKLEILCGLKKGGMLLLNGDEPLLSRIHGKSYHTLYVSVESNTADFFAQNIRVNEGKTVFDLHHGEKICRDVTIPVAGRHNVYAALFAYATGTLRGMGEEEIRRGLLKFCSAGLRQNIYHLSDITVYEDCYNASPESMRAAISTLSGMSAGRTVAVLGDMLELGKSTTVLHRAVGAHLVSCDVVKLVAVGALGAEIAQGAREAGMREDDITLCPDREDIGSICKEVCNILQSGDTVLFKASRSVGLERSIEQIKNQYQGTKE